MQIELTEQQKALKNEVRTFLEKEIAPLVEVYEREGRLITSDIVKKVLPFGYIGGLLPREVGGYGLDLISYFSLIEELTRVWPSLRIYIASANLIATYINKYGTEEAKKKYMPGLLNGDISAYFALTEPDAGSDAGSIKLKAELQGENYILNGTKAYVALGDGELGLVFAVTDPEKGAKGITAFLIERDFSPYSIRQIQKMGTHAASMVDITFKDTVVPAENMIGGMGQGLPLAMNFLNTVRSAIPFICAGVGQACLEASVKYAKERTQFGKPLAKFQLIQEKIANMAIKIEAIKLLGYQAAYLVEKGVPCQKEVSMAKVFASEYIKEVCQDAIQIHGAAGYMKDLPIERYYRDISYFTIADGTSEIHRLIIGKNILGTSAYV